MRLTTLLQADLLCRLAGDALAIIITDIETTGFAVRERTLQFSVSQGNGRTRSTDSSSPKASRPIPGPSR